MDHSSGAFTQVHSQRLEKNTICGGIEMMVYKVDWDKIDLNEDLFLDKTQNNIVL